jgi:HK97 family phage portal protein
MHSLVADVCIFGNAYHEKLEAGDARALLPLPPYYVTPRGGSLVQAAVYDYEGGEDTRRIAADNVFHARRYNPNDLRIGLSPLEPLRQILSGEREALIANYDLWTNSARMAGVIERDKDDHVVYTDEQKAQYREAWQAAYAGRGNSSKTVILDPGQKFKEAVWSPRESEFIEGRKLTLETVCRAFNIPVSLMGLTDTATFASQKEFHRQLYVDTLGPWFRMIEAEVQAQIVPWFTSDPEVYVEFNVEEKLRLSFEEQAEALRNAVGVPTMTVNEGRALQNLPRVDAEEFDEPVRPANVNYAGQEGEAPMPEVRQLRATGPTRAADAATLEDKERDTG